MIKRKMGQAGRAASPLMALALLLAGAAPAFAQDTPAPSSSRPLDFRLPPPTDDNRAPGVQGPSDNGLPPVAPGERRGQPTPTPAPAPIQPATPPRVTPTQPVTATTPAPAPARRDTPATPRPASPDAATQAAPVTTGNPALPPPETVAPAASPATEAPPVAASDDTLAAAAPASAPSGTPIWAWALAALAALGAGYWYWRRRSALAGPSIDEADEAPRPAAPAPATRAAAPKPAAPARPAPPQPAPVTPLEPRAASPLVTRPAGEKRAVVGMALDIRSIRFAADHVAVGFALNLLNQGTVAATGLMVRIALNQGSAMPEAVLGRFFDGAGGSVLRDDIMLAPGAGEELSTEVMLPRAAIEPLMIGGKPMLVPVIAFDVTYHWDGEGEAFGQNAGSFVLGREQGASGSEKLAPLPLDRAAYAVDRPGARATAIKRSL
ncbi:hypothetical protein ACIPPQ_01260 [Sphingopyxis sp. LARHCG72]